MREASDKSDLAERLGPAIMTLRIIVVALASGVAAFAVAAVVIRMQQAAAQANDADGLLTTLGIAAAPVALLLSRFLPGTIVANSRRQIASGQYGSAGRPPAPQASGSPSSAAAVDDDAKLFMVYQTKTIIAAALLEGAAFLNIVAFLLGGNLIALGVACLLALAIAAMFPRTSSVVEWIEGQRRLMAEEKLLAR